MRTGQGLQIDQDLAFQRREWRGQRLGWWLLSAFVVAAALGLFGSGVLSRAHARAPDHRLAVDYERFIRVGAPTRLAIRAAGSDRVELRVDRAWFESLAVQRITPEPAHLAIAGDTVYLTFTTGAQGECTVLLDVEPLHAGRYRTTVQVGGAQAVTLTQLAYF
jgi:hypothetical protein